MLNITHYQFSSVAQSCPTLCDLMNRSMPGLPVHHQLPEFTQTHVSACLFFNSSRSLFIDSCVFSVLFSRFLIIFTIIILNSFSGSFPIYSSFIWTFVFLVCSFICVVFSAFSLLFFLTYYVWGLLFPGFKVEFFLPFGFYPPKFGPMVCVSFL